ncbi:MAG: 3-oxoacyl-[acyl-carrier-protein] reductase [Desulfomicrobiaceae bacterium]
MSDTIRTALVTGGTRGIGKAIVTTLAERGYHVYFTYVSRPELAEELCASLSPAPVRGFRVDAGDPAAIAQFFAEEIKDKVFLAALINNAGITRDGLLVRMKLAAWEEVLRVNLTGAFVFLQEAAKIMMRQRFGRIVSIASVVGQMGNAGQANYCAAKAGLIGLTKSAALELAPRGITVNAVAPGFIETDMTGGLSQEIRDAYQARIPLGRLGSAQDVAEATAFLLSDAAAYITGQVIGVNGGMYL